MSSTSETLSSQLAAQLAGPLANAVPAANADELSEAQVAERQPELTITTTLNGSSGPSGWDAHEVWRRFFKEARARRRPQE